MKALLWVIGSLILFAGGCATNSVGGGSVFDAEGVPLARYYVGGGLHIEYKAPQAGTVYLVETHSKTILGTRSLETGQVFDVTLDISSDDVHMALKSSGVDPLKCKFALYFVPAE